MCVPLLLPSFGIAFLCFHSYVCILNINSCRSYCKRICFPIGTSQTELKKGDKKMEMETHHITCTERVNNNSLNCVLLYAHTHTHSRTPFKMILSVYLSRFLFFFSFTVQEITSAYVKEEKRYHVHQQIHMF